MKSKRVTYWIATAVLCAFAGSAAFSYLSKDPKMMAGFASLGYPMYFPTILGVAKALGVVALLLPGLPRLKEWAYAGFVFTFLGAICSHVEMEQSKEALLPLANLVVLVVSYCCRPADRKLANESEAELHPEIVRGAPAR